MLAYTVGGRGALVIAAVSDATNHRIGSVLVGPRRLAAALLARSPTPLVEAELGRGAPGV